MKRPTLRSRRVVAGGVAIAASVAAASGLLLNQVAFASTTHASGGHGGSAKGLGQLSGLLSPDKFTLGSAIDINLTNETAPPHLPRHRLRRDTAGRNSVVSPARRLRLRTG